MVSNFNIQGDNLTKNSKANGKPDNNNDHGFQYINFGEDDQMEIQGFVISKLKCNICVILYLLTMGILRLIFHWYPVLHLKATHRKCDLKVAEELLIRDIYNGKTSTHFVKKIISLSSDSLEGNYAPNIKKLLKFGLTDGNTREKYQIRVVNCKKLTYVWDEDKETFIKLAGLENGISRAGLHQFKGQSSEEQIRKRIVYGNNEIVTPEQTVMQLLILEALTPFYMFQLFSLLVWLAEQYYYYSVAIVIMSVFGISTSILQTRKNQKNLKGTVNFTSMVTVRREDGIFEETSTTCLVPGDVVVIPSQGCEMHCDAVLLNGNCIVNESMLTGESVPITKTPLDYHEMPYSLKEDVNHTLFCGTKVIQTRSHENGKVLAVVIRTGFLTTKGELVRSILYPPPADFKFDRDSYKYIAILAGIAVLGVIYTVVSKSSRQIDPADIAIKALDIITIVIPPALPAAMTVGKLFALHRLKLSKIFCINSRVINVSGSVNCICFDKTGTLTEDALDMWGVVPVVEKCIENPIRNVEVLTSSADLFRGMATCHSLTVIEGKIGGDPLDVKMFESTGWIFEDNHLPGKSYGDFVPAYIVRTSQMKENGTIDEIGIVKQYHFSSTLQRMSVITKSPGRGQFEVFCKGSPEKVISLSNKDSVPEGIYRTLNKYTEQGYRVIGLASKQLPQHLLYKSISKCHRDDVEKDLGFLGLLVFENRLKPQSEGVIKVLKDARLKVIMITGDNIQTAVTVARECHIIDESCTAIEIYAEEPTKQKSAIINYLALKKPSTQSYTNGKVKDIESTGENNRKYNFVVSGQSWSNVVKYFPELIPKIMIKGAVFARMSGAQKAQLVEYLKNLGYYVAMCGDGANDCGALKAAHVGISLSEAESSVASPFTSKEANISCAPKIIKEGRAALVTSFGVFQMMICYSLTEFTSVMILYAIDTNLSSMQFLFIDVCLVLNFAATFGRTQANTKLAKTPPRTSLLSFVPLCSITLFMLLAAGSQLFSYHYIQTFEWFHSFEYDPSESGITTFAPSFENYAVYCTSMFQYIIMAITFSKGKPYRKNIFTNLIFIFCLLSMTIICGYMTLFSADWFAEVMELQMPTEMDGRWMCIYVSLVTFAACYIVQCFLVEVVLEKWIEPAFSKCSKNRKEHVDVAKELRNDPLWPPTSRESLKFIKINEKMNGVDNVGFVESDGEFKCVKL
ncbi:polyamine-transporting ATPase 13A3-like isoform X1 [Euwallacea fornicatus]|uniref:polyamine-transporting ATPase 13A3-like isoform X1 n=1 Tax=Euwallacea fornicatus TaxID=995702 RepID=UPI00338FCCD2